MAAVKANIDIGVLNQLDIRVGTITAVSDVEQSRKLLKLSVDFGSFTRTILSAMRGERENPQEIVGKQALFVVNMAPRTMAGEVSEGMLFDLGYEDGMIPVLAQPEKQVPNGTRAG
ncbi:MAG: tRNA-binding protein [Neisseriaceae bacterium]|nr:tRNA-binding protein [Neisseriaceae bacterium]MBP6863128.1 tRNA-binding protein [Neisseriaceae bacterium]